MNKRIFGTTLACAGLLTATAACSGSDSGGKSDGPVTVTVMTWESPETNTAIKKALEGFKDDNVKVAGVVVGKVIGIKVVDGRAVVRIEVRDSTKIPTDTSAAVRWRFTTSSAACP